MKVQRISEKSLKQILDGQTKYAVSVIKFYSLGCDFCHALSEHYTAMAKEEKYADVNFFAYNIDEDSAIVDSLGLNGVPTISLVRCRDQRAKVVTLEDPQDPHPKTWYTVNYIKNFIDKERTK